MILTRIKRSSSTTNLTSVNALWSKTQFFQALIAERERTFKSASLKPVALSLQNQA